MIKYAHESKLAYRITTQLLDEDGPIQKNDYLRDELGAGFFLALAEANPESAVKCLKNTIGTWSKDELKQFTTGRRQVVWALEKIVIWKELFLDAARLLLMLGEAENETWGNNASGVFATLFSPGTGSVAPSEASPQERFPILKEALESDSKERRLLALRACNEALQTEHFGRMVGNERQGLRKEPELWSPKTYGELFDAYRQVWNLLLDRLDDLLNNEQQEAVDILIRHIGGLGRIGNLADMVIETIKILAKKSYVDNRKILVNVTHFLQFEGKEIPVEMLKRWEQIRDELTENDFSSRIKRYVGISVWDIRGDDNKELIPKKTMELAHEAFQNKDLLRNELDWLMTEDAKGSHTFGYMLGKLDQTFSLLPELLSAQRNHRGNTSVYLLGGYLKALYESEPENWEDTLDKFARDEKLRMWLPEITWRSGTSDKSSLQILRLAEKGDIDILQSRIPVYGGIGISEEVFKRWISFLLGHQDIRAIYIALDWYHFYYIRKDSQYILPEELTLRLLLHKSFYEKSDMRINGQLADYLWTQIALEIIKVYPAKALSIANMIIKHFEEDGTIFQGYNPQTNEVLIEIAKRYPHEVWGKITNYLGPPIDSRAFKLSHWLRGRDIKYHEYEKPPMSLFSLEDLWAWVDMDVKKRARYLASFVPKELSKKENEMCLARELLIRYGERQDVRSNLISNFETGVFSGEASLHFQILKKELIAFRDEEDNEKVRKWIDEYIEILDKEIEQWKMREEREF